MVFEVCLTMGVLYFFRNIYYLITTTPLTTILQTTLNQTPIPFHVTPIITQTISSLDIWLIIITLNYFRLATWYPRGQSHYINGIFSIPNIFIPWIILALFVLWRDTYFGVAIILVGILQERLYKEMFIQMPYVFYSGV